MQSGASPQNPKNEGKSLKQNGETLNQYKIVMHADTNIWTIWLFYWFIFNKTTPTHNLNVVNKKRKSKLYLCFVVVFFTFFFRRRAYDSLWFTVIHFVVLMISNLYLFVVYLTCFSYGIDSICFNCASLIMLWLCCDFLVLLMKQTVGIVFSFVWWYRLLKYLLKIS